MKSKTSTKPKLTGWACHHLVSLFYQIGKRKARDIIEKEKKKMGRPTDSPKIHQTRIRMTDEELNRLEYCSKKLEMTKTDVINKGIEKIYQDLKKKE